MSADLLEAFGQDPVSEDHKQAIVSSGLNRAGDNPEDSWQPWPSQPHEHKSTINHNDDDQLWKTQAHGNDILFDADETGQGFPEDGFGDFEQPEVVDNEQPEKEDVSNDLLGLTEPETSNEVANKQPGVALAAVDPQLHILPNLLDDEDSGLRQEQQRARTDTYNDPPNADEDWGDFEAVTSSQNTVDTSRNAISARSNNSMPPGLADQARLATKTSKQVPPGKPATATVDSFKDEDFGAWDEFDDASQPSTDRAVDSEHEPNGGTETWTAREGLPVTGERPNNIPPPAVLLALLTKVVASLATHARQSAKIEEVGKSAAEVYRVSARIIAGRQLRWKRDNMLSQSMRIGAAGRSGGMKLASLDKGESRKEEQEGEDLLATWTRSSPVLNQAMVKAKSPKPPLSLSAKFVVRTATGVDILTAPLICPICGLKRNERVNGIDVSVSDTFGEFWTEKWGHTDCATFWYQHHHLLDQR